jgi:hypothetical protein
VTLKGTTVSVTVDGQAALGYVFNAPVVDGEAGVIVRGGTASFAGFALATDDPQYRADTPGDELIAAYAPLAAGVPTPISESDLQAVADVAITSWMESGYVSSDQLAVLRDVTLSLDDLGGLVLGRATDTSIVIDRTAAGHGWHSGTDSIPGGTVASRAADGGIRVDLGTSATGGRMDLLSALVHEYGHALGFDHGDFGDAFGDPMFGQLGVGVRSLPSTGDPGAAGAAPLGGAMDVALGLHHVTSAFATSWFAWSGDPLGAGDLDEERSVARFGNSASSGINRFSLFAHEGEEVRPQD